MMNDEQEQEQERDLYGWPLLNLSVHDAAVRIACDGAAARNERAWLEWGQQQQLPPPALLKALARKGVPPPMRPWVWMAASGAAGKRAATPDTYAALVAAALPPPAYEDAVGGNGGGGGGGGGGGDGGTKGLDAATLHEIDLDLPHTLPGHAWLASPDGQAAMRRVLAAFAARSAAGGGGVGYVRGLNAIVGCLLCCLNRNEDAAFWLLATIVEEVAPPALYDRTLAGAAVELSALGGLLRQKLPRLHEHLRALDADVAPVVSVWWLSAYAGALPSEAWARVADALLVERSFKVAWRVALALLKQAEPALLRADNAAEAFLALRADAVAAHDRDGLMELAFHGIGSLPLAAIEHARAHVASSPARDSSAGGGGGGGGGNDDEEGSNGGASGGAAVAQHLRGQAAVAGRMAVGAVRKLLAGGKSRRDGGGDGGIIDRVDSWTG